MNDSSESHPRRPPRIVPFQDRRSFWFVTFCTRHRRPILANADVHEALLSFARRARDEHAVCVGSYVIMPDHLHFFVVLSDTGPRLAPWVGQLKRHLGVTLASLQHQRPHWQEGFFDHLMRSGDSYSAKWDYVRQNPVRAGLCATPEVWPYSGEIVPLRF